MQCLGLAVLATEDTEVTEKVAKKGVGGLGSMPWNIALW